MQVQWTPQPQFTWRVKSIVHNSGTAYVVGTEGNLGCYDKAQQKMVSMRSNWTLNDVFWIGNQMFGIGTDDNVGVYDPESGTFGKSGNWAGWKLKCAFVNAAGTAFCVGTDYNLGTMAFPYIQWQSVRCDWQLLSVCQGSNDTLLVVGTNNNLGQIPVGGGTVTSLNSAWDLVAVDPDGAGNVYCVGKNNNVGYHEGGIG
jgi:hypothetical protein